jgi:hypothetical protein
MADHIVSSKGVYDCCLSFDNINNNFLYYQKFYLLKYFSKLVEFIEKKEDGYNMQSSLILNRNLYNIFYYNKINMLSCGELQQLPAEFVNHFICSDEYPECLVNFNLENDMNNCCDDNELDDLCECSDDIPAALETINITIDVASPGGLSNTAIYPEYECCGESNTAVLGSPVSNPVYSAYSQTDTLDYEIVYTGDELPSIPFSESFTLNHLFCNDFIVPQKVNINYIKNCIDTFVNQITVSGLSFTLNTLDSLINTSALITNNTQCCTKRTTPVRDENWEIESIEIPTQFQGIITLLDTYPITNITTATKNILFVIDPSLLNFVDDIAEIYFYVNILSCGKYKHKAKIPVTFVYTDCIVGSTTIETPEQKSITLNAAADSVTFLVEMGNEDKCCDNTCDFEIVKIESVTNTNQYNVFTGNPYDVYVGPLFNGCAFNFKFNVSYIGGYVGSPPGSPIDYKITYKYCGNTYTYILNDILTLINI